MKERLQKLISGAGLASRRAAEEMIKAGRVKVNGETAVLGMSADPDTDTVTVDGKRLRQPETRVYIMLNKPQGYVCSTDDGDGPTVFELIKKEDMRPGLFPGRTGPGRTVGWSGSVPGRRIWRPGPVSVPFPGRRICRAWGSSWLT